MKIFFNIQVGIYIIFIEYISEADPARNPTEQIPVFVIKKIINLQKRKRSNKKPPK